MKPDAVLLTDVRDGLDGVEGPEDGRADGTVDEKGKVALALVTYDQLLKLCRNHAATGNKTLKHLHSKVLSCLLGSVIQLLSLICLLKLKIRTFS